MRANVHNHVDVDRLTWGCDACIGLAREARYQGERQALLDDGDWCDVTIHCDVNVGALEVIVDTCLRVPDGFDGVDLQDFIEADQATSDELKVMLIKHALKEIKVEDVTIDWWEFEVDDD